MHNEASHRTFKIYFVLSTFLLATCLALYCILRLIQVCQMFRCDSISLQLPLSVGE